MIEAWQNALKEFLRPRSVLVGIGNALRGDDAFGVVLADRLSGKVRWPVLSVGETPENHIGPILSSEPDRVLLMDAVTCGAAPGRIAFFAPDEILCGGVSTHAASLGLFAEMLCAWGGCSAAVLGAEPCHMEMAAPLSDEVAHGVNVVAAFVEELGSASSDRTRARGRSE